MSLGNDPARFDGQDKDAHHAVAAASEARMSLLIDGPAPSRERILREMGRNPDGTALDEDARPPHEAGEVARQLARSEGRL